MAWFTTVVQAMLAWFEGAPLLAFVTLAIIVGAIVMLASEGVRLDRFIFWFLGAVLVGGVILAIVPIVQNGLAAAGGG